MTLNEYLKKILKQIQDSSSEAEAISVVEKAQKVLDDSNISESSKEQFWIDLYEELGGDYILVMESQGSSALSEIIAAAKTVIAQKLKK